jgi:hypothetical protein
MGPIVRIAAACLVLCTVACRPKTPGHADEEAEPEAPDLDPELASELVGLSLACVDREYPNKPGNVVDGDETVMPPRRLHPAFFGCFDWHSAVHGHWAMVRVLRTHPGIEEAGEIREVLDRHLNEETMRGELEFFEHERNRLFERPYGWGWLLRLAAELATWEDPDARRWQEAVAPLAELLAERTVHYLGILSVPVRAGTHHSTAYALCHIHDYATAVRNRTLLEAIERRSRDFYLADRSCPAAYEPSGEDFISPCLAEADLMRRVLGREEFSRWLDGFLPGIVLSPPEVKDPRDPRVGHLIGLSLHRASAYRGIASALAVGDPRRSAMLGLAATHRDDGLGRMFESGYGGEHWLASFAIALLTDSGPY